MAVPFPNPLDIIGSALPLIAVVVALFIAVKIGPPIVGRLRQRSYDAAVAGETQRLEVSIGPGRTGSAEAAVGLIRGLHPQRRLGADGWWPRGWPGFELRTIRPRALNEAQATSQHSRETSLTSIATFPSLCSRPTLRAASTSLELELIRLPNASPGRLQSPSFRRQAFATSET